MYIVFSYNNTILHIFYANFSQSRNSPDYGFSFNKSPFYYQKTGKKKYHYITQRIWNNVY